jgi:FkbM family methyltransferase
MSLQRPTIYDRDRRAFLGRHRDAWWLAPVRRGAGWLHHALNWSDNDPHSNGEAEVVDLLPAAPTVVDVGAHVGEWTDLVLARRPQARAVLAEACPDQRASLVRRYADDDRVVVHRAGLAAAAGTSPFARYPDDPRLSSTVAYPHPLPATWIEVDMTTGDELLDELGIDHVDLVKIDTEGSELSIIRGFGGALAAGRIDRIQFEYGQANIYSRSLLHDLYEHLTAHGFALGRVARAGVHEHPYHPDLETFFVANYLAIRQSR